MANTTTMLGQENKEEVIPYFEYVLIEPVEKKQILVAENAKLETYGKVVAIGPEVTHTKVGDYVAFELWDVKDCSLNAKKLYTVKESQLILKIPMSLVLAA